MSDALARRVGLAIFVLSGIPGLMAQMAWARVFAAGLGHELPALLGVTTVFLAGLALGARALDARVSGSARPGLWYAGLECASGVWIALGLGCLPWLNDLALRWTGLAPSPLWQACVAFGVPAVAILPSAMAMGGTLPAMERAMAPHLPAGRGVAWLYGANTAGAMIGVVWAVQGMMPAWGFRATLGLAAVLQGVCALLAFLVFRRGSSAGEPLRDAEPSTLSTPGDRIAPVLWAVTGLLGMAYQWTAIRVLAQVSENTVHTYAGALVLYLAGTTAGAWLVGMRMRRGGALRSESMLGVLAVVVTCEMVVLSAILRGQSGGTAMLGARGWELGVAALVFLPPTMAMGALFSMLVQAARRSGGGVGRASAWNTLGSAVAGPLAMGVGVPLLGTRAVMSAVALGYLVLAWVGSGAGRARGGGWKAVAVGALVALGVALPPWSFVHVELPAGSEVAKSMEGRMATVTVIRTPDSHRALRVNNHFQQGGTASAVAARRHAHLPLLLHPDPRRALFLGVGTGITLGAAASHPGLEADGVELLSEVLSMLPAFEPENGAPGRSARSRLHHADARRFVRCDPTHYDVIVADLFHPAEDGAGFLYTRDHFAAVRARLAPGGLFCQWLPLHQMDLGVFRDVAATFVSVFPESSLWLLRFNVDVPVIGLIGTAEPQHWDPTALARRMESEPLSGALGPLSLNQPLRVLGCLLADREGLRRMTVGGEVGTDDWPTVLFRAPRLTYQRTDRPSERLSVILDEAQFSAVEALRGEEAVGWGRRWEAYRSARDLHLRGLMSEEAGKVDAAVTQYLASVEASPDYTSGYAQVVLVASAYSKEKPEYAEALLRRLIALRPEQRLAREVLDRLNRETRTGRGP